MRTLCTLLLLLAMGTGIALAQISGVAITPAGAGPTDTITIIVYPEQTYPLPDERDPPSAFLESLANAPRVRLHAGVGLSIGRIYPDSFFHYHAWRFNVGATNDFSQPGPNTNPGQQEMTYFPDGTWRLTMVPGRYFAAVATASRPLVVSQIESMQFVFAGGPDDVHAWSRVGRSDTSLFPWYPRVGRIPSDFHVPFPIPAAWSAPQPPTRLRPAGPGIFYQVTGAAGTEQLVLTVRPGQTLPLGTAHSLPSNQPSDLYLHAGLVLPGRTGWAHQVEATAANAQVTRLYRQPDGSFRKVIRLREYFNLSPSEPLGRLEFSLAGGSLSDLWSRFAAPAGQGSHFSVPLTPAGVTVIKPAPAPAAILERLADGAFRLKAQTQGDVPVRIFDTLGRLVAQGHTVGGTYQGTLLQPGLYTFLVGTTSLKAAF